MLDAVVKTTKHLALKLLPQSVLGFLKKGHYGRIVARFSEQDAQDIKVMKRLVKPSDYVVDIGANIGCYTKILSGLVGRNGKVCSIEPVPLSFGILGYCADKLGLENVELKNCALSEQDGFTVMRVPEYKEGGENYYEAHIRKGLAESDSPGNDRDNILRELKVPTRTMDSLFAGAPQKISFVKCDVEGHELQVFRGAYEIIKRDQPALYVEVAATNPDCPNSDANKLFLLLNQLGYTAWCLVVLTTASNIQMDN